MIEGEVRAGADSYFKHATLYILKQPLSPFTEPALSGIPFIYRACLLNFRMRDCLFTRDSPGNAGFDRRFHDKLANGFHDVLVKYAWNNIRRVAFLIRYGGRDGFWPQPASSPH